VKAAKHYDIPLTKPLSLFGATSSTSDQVAMILLAQLTYQSPQTQHPTSQLSRQHLPIDALSLYDPSLEDEGIPAHVSWPDRVYWTRPTPNKRQIHP
jgi:hypothetical protein